MILTFLGNCKNHPWLTEWEGWPQYISECENAVTCPAWLDISGVMAPATNNDNDRPPATQSHRRQICKLGMLECGV